MPIFVILGNFTQKRMENIKGLPESIKEGPKVFESFGVKISSLIFTMGRYDLVAIGEAPDAETMTKALLSWGSKGLLRTETLTGFSAEEMIKLVKEI
ncbi:MAG: GYD domain-containing protein [Candidatus Bathyarchaeota archaeon]|nr:GYD domain-containing protein [Candidatus Bathyarchaeota archaeon]